MSAMSTGFFFHTLTAGPSTAAANGLQTTAMVWQKSSRERYDRASLAYIWVISLALALAEAPTAVSRETTPWLGPRIS